ncbi:MAG: hypothetical protein AB7O96_06755 [Pseudobdellovibrionaceae bacterium]
MKSPRMKISLGLVSVLAFSLAINYFLRPQNGRDSDLRQNRGLASREDEKQFNSELIKSEHKMAESLSYASGNRGVASLGPAQANLIETLQEQSLGGRLKYHIQRTRETGKVMAINFYTSADSEEKPIHVKPIDLLTRYQDIWAVSFNNFEPEPKNENNSFLLFDQEHNTVGRARFTFNDEGKFMSLQIEPLSPPK